MNSGVVKMRYSQVDICSGITAAMFYGLHKPHEQETLLM